MSEMYRVRKAFKGNGKKYKPGDTYEPGGMWDHKLLTTRYIEKVDASEEKMVADSKARLADIQQKALHPEGFVCEECGFEAKSKAGLVSHTRKHQEE